MATRPAGFLDKDGNPLAGGLLFIYFPGSRRLMNLAKYTPLPYPNTHQEAERAIEPVVETIPNPIILDSNGMADIPEEYLGQPATIELRDQNYEIIFTRTTSPSHHYQRSHQTAAEVRLLQEQANAVLEARLEQVRLSTEHHIRQNLDRVMFGRDPADPNGINTEDLTMANFITAGEICPQCGGRRVAANDYGRSWVCIACRCRWARGQDVNLSGSAGNHTHTMASAIHPSYFATCATMISSVPFHNAGTRGIGIQGGTGGYGYRHEAPTTPKKLRFNEQKELRKKLKAESTAQILLQNFIGFDQWKIYRRSNRVIVKPGKFFWIIGNYFGNYVKGVPFSGKPDVIRIDDADSGAATSFCVEQRGGKPTPYTDKVIAFMVHLVNDERGFYKMANKMGEFKFDPKRECALWNIQ